MKPFNSFFRLQSLLALIILVGLLTACGGRAASSRQADYGYDTVSESEASMDAPAAPMPTMYAEESKAEAGYAGPDDSDGNAVNISIEDTLANTVAQAQLATRIIIYTGDMSLVVQDTAVAVAQITQLAEEKGGYVSGSNLYQSGDVPRGSITLRVPANLYQETLASLRALSVRVERESSFSQDVTEEFTDLQARKTNLEYTEAALQELLEERQNMGRTSDILEVHRELTNIRGQIEQIEGRLRYLTNQAALSTITVELIPDVLYQPVSVAGWEPTGVAKEALQSLVATLQGLISIAIWLVIYMLPLLIILLTPIVIVVLIIRWWLKRRQQKKQDEPETEQE